MRHLGSIILSLLVAPLVYVLIGAGLIKFPQAAIAADRDLPNYPVTLASLGALLVAGLLYALLTVARLSPLGPVLAGLAFLGVGLWPLLRLDSFQRTMPRDVLGVPGAGVEAAGGVSLLLAIPLLATIVSAHRWRRHERAPVADAYPDISEAAAAEPYPPSGYPATPNHPATLGHPAAQASPPPYSPYAPTPMPASEGDPAGEEDTRPLPQHPPATYPPPDTDATRRL